MNFSMKKLSEEFQNRVPFYTTQKAGELIRAGKIKALKENVDRASDFVEISSVVSSQRNYDHYDVFILIDGNTSKIEDTHCECLDYKSNITSSNKYICKHIAAALSKYISLRIAKNKDSKNIKPKTIKLPVTIPSEAPITIKYGEK